MLGLKETVTSSDGKGKLSELIWACVEEGWRASFEKSIEVRSEGQEEVKTTKEDASGEGEQECWFGEKGCHKSSEMESGSWRDCCQSGVNLATPIYGDKPGSKIFWIDWLIETKITVHCISNVDLSTAILHIILT